MRRILDSREGSSPSVAPILSLRNVNLVDGLIWSQEAVRSNRTVETNFAVVVLWEGTGLSIQLRRVRFPSTAPNNGGSSGLRICFASRLTRRVRFPRLPPIILCSSTRFRTPAFQVGKTGSSPVQSTKLTLTYGV